MTGAFLRIKRDGKWQSIEIDQLTATELDGLAFRQPDKGWLWVKFLVQWIQENIEADKERAQ